MEFEQFISKIDLLKNGKLPGIDAHKLLAPLQRPVFDKYNTPENARLAAVLILIYPDEKNKTSILLTKRASYNGKHSNQISFPGGKKEKEDANLQTTAIRETQEEVGIENVTMVKEMTNIYIPPSNFSVNPYMGFIKEPPAFLPNHEVSQIIQFPVEELLNPNTVNVFDNSSLKNIPCFNYNGHIIWGATAMILSEVKELLKTSF
ncbi:NUDIX hydrolase [Wenyingzhuangia sp. IMCC45574]